MPDWFEQHAPTAEAPAPAADWFAANAPKADFSTTTSASEGVVNNDQSPSALELAGEVVKGVAQNLNPYPLLKAMYEEHGRQEQAGTDAFTGAVSTVALPILRGLKDSELAQFEKAKTAWKAGRISEALGHTLAMALPIAGPMAADAAEKIGTGDPRQMAHGTGEALALAAPKGVKAIADAASIRIPPVLENRSPADRSAVAFGEAQGIPIDAATATGSKAVAHGQKMAAANIGGAAVAEPFKATQTAGLTRVGRGLANDIAPPITTEQAGTQVRDALTAKIEDLHGQANDAYRSLREMEADPAHAEQVAVPIELTSVMKNRMKGTLGEIPSTAEIREMQRIREELDAVPFQRGRLSRDPGAGFDAGDETYSPRAAGAPVYHDILQESPQGSSMTRAKVLQSVDAAIQTGIFNNTARGALAVARKRLAPGGADYAGLSRPILPPDAGVKTAGMLLPVDIRPTKISLAPIYESLKRESELVPLHGAKARALVALDKLMNGKDHQSLSIVDGALSEIKAMARGADLPELRNQGQGIAAKAVQDLDKQVRLAALRAGPEALKALDQGRAATRAKYAAADVLKQLQKEPVKTANALMAPSDANLQRLRSVVREVPDVAADLGRAWLEDKLNLATERNGFDHADKLYADWQKLGNQTKRIVFKDPVTVQALNDFFLLAKKISEMPNTSGTAYALNATKVIAAVPNYVLAKALYSPSTVRLLTKGLRVSISGAPPARAAAVGLISRALSDVQAMPAAAAGPARDTTPAAQR